MPTAKMKGAEVKRKEDPRLIQGQGTYVPNIVLPNMLHAHFVRSPHPHASIKAIDMAAAVKSPGVVAIYTGEEIAKATGPMMWGPEDSGARPRSKFPLAVGTVRFVGEAVAVVIARSVQEAADAAQRVDVDYDLLPASANLLDTLKSGAAVVHASAAGNIDHKTRITGGDVDAAFAAAHKVIKQRMVNQRVLGMPMETRGTLAQPDAWTRGLTVWTSTQAAHWIRRDLAKMFKLPENAIRVIAPDVGGGFGLKVGVFPEDVVISYAARTLGQPVKWIEGRSEHALATTHGRAQISDVEAAIDARGVLTGLRTKIYADLGAYPVAVDIPDLTVLMGNGTYTVKNVDIESICVYTHTTPVAAYRGAGRPEAAYYIERVMDLIAAEMQMDPGEVRKRNYIQPAEFPYKTPLHQVYDSGEYEKSLNKAIEISGYQKLREEQARRRKNGERKLLGIGFSTYVEMCGFGPYESAQVRVEPSGSVTVTTGISPHGQGGATTFSQLVADELGVDMDKVQVHYGDTGNTPQGNGTMGSRSIVVGGSALVRAAGKVREKAIKIAAHVLEADPADIVLTDGKYHVKGAPAKGLDLGAIASKAYTDSLPADIETGLEFSDFFRPPGLVYPFGTHVAVVEVDADTGDTRVLDFYSVDDCGPRISPNLVAGQIHGGIAQGLGQAIYEDARYSDEGQLRNPTFMDYAVPRAAYMPRIHIAETVTPTPLNPLGVKGIGEAATVGSTPAIANAVADALSHLGVRHVDIPLTAECVWKAMNPDRK